MLGWPHTVKSCAVKYHRAGLSSADLLARPHARIRSIGESPARRSIAVIDRWTIGGSHRI